MKIKLLLILVLYYVIIGIFFSFGSSIYGGNGYSHKTDLNDSALLSSDLDTGGLFSTGMSFTRFLFLMVLGIGLPMDTPLWFILLFATWQTCVTLFSIVLVIDAIWSG